MDKFIVTGGNKLRGKVHVSGAKNVALKALIAACLTDEKVVIKNVPLISDVRVMFAIIKDFGGQVTVTDHTVTIRMKKFRHSCISLEEAAQTRTASMFIAPLLLRTGSAMIPNPGGCRIGARPIDRTIRGLQKMGADIEYKSADGFFHAKTHGDPIGRRSIDRTIIGLRKMGARITHEEQTRTYHADSGGRLKGISYLFEKNTHTGTETMIIAATLAVGKTILENAAQEPEVDELIEMLNGMGANIVRIKPRTIVIEGVEALHGTTFTICPDRNEIVTFAIAAIATKGDILIEGANEEGLLEFLSELKKVGGGYEVRSEGIRFYYYKPIRGTNITTKPYPAFMTDWQAPWAVLMTQALGISTIHETVFENRFGYVNELLKMGALITQYNPKITDPSVVYNFNSSDSVEGDCHAIKINGPETLHNAVVEISDLRAGATLVIAALIATGSSTIFGIEKLDRGYEHFENRLTKLGADVKRLTDPGIS